MKTISFTLPLLAFVLTLSCARALSCSANNPPVFSEFADNAPQVFVGKVISMRLVRGPVTFDDGHQGEAQAIESEITIEKNLRGTANHFKKMQYVNWACFGFDIRLGHLYLIATDQTGEILELDSRTVAIGDITPIDEIAENGPYSIDVSSNDFVLEAERSLREQGKFSGSFLDRLPPPHVLMQPVEVSIEMPKTRKAARSKRRPTKISASPP